MIRCCLTRFLLNFQSSLNFYIESKILLLKVTSSSFLKQHSILKIKICLLSCIQDFQIPIKCYD